MLGWMRQLFNGSVYAQQFFNNAIDLAKKNNFTGWNIDWEPEDGVRGPNATAQDGLDYAQFLDTFAKVLHAENIELTVDIASWSPLWDFEHLAATGVDRLCNMDTYTGNFNLFKSKLSRSVKQIGFPLLGVGLEVLNENRNRAFNTTELYERFELLYSVDAQEIDLWDMPMSDDMWNFVDTWLIS